MELKEFKKLKKHIVYNMFFALRVVAPKRKGFILSSVGDHLDANNSQDCDFAEVAIAVTIDSTPSKELIYNLNCDDHWHVVSVHDTEQFSFSVRKRDQLIVNRSYEDAG
jgi:hypothetical protein